MSTTVDKQDRTGVQVVHRVASILMALRGQPAGLSLSQIAQQVGLARSTVHRLVAALEQERLVVPASSSGGYRLGPAVAGLALSISREFTVTLHPFLEELSRELNETVDLAVLDHDGVIFVDQVPAAGRRLRAVSAVGAIFPAHCTANGKALLAALPNEEVERLLPARLQRLTPQTITSRTKLLAELARIRTEGVAYDREEHTIGICAVGVAIDVPADRVAVTVPMPAQRFFGNEQQLSAALLRAKRSVEDVVGMGG